MVFYAYEPPRYDDGPLYDWDGYELDPRECTIAMFRTRGERWRWVMSDAERCFCNGHDVRYLGHASRNPDMNWLDFTRGLHNDERIRQDNLP